jgi:hypothetical protein
VKTYTPALAVLLCFSVLNLGAVEKQASYAVRYSGGSLSTVKGGEYLKLFIDPAAVRLEKRKEEPMLIPAAAITEVSYGQEVHRRVGTAIGLAVISLGIGAFMLFSKSKKHYIGLVWDDAGKKGGIAFQADKNEYRGLLAALEGISGKKAVNTDPPGK